LAVCQIGGVEKVREEKRVLLHADAEGDRVWVGFVFIKNVEKQRIT
jgi:hypothetical protein